METIVGFMAGYLVGTSEGQAGLALKPVQPEVERDLAAAGQLARPSRVGGDIDPDHADGPGEPDRAHQVVQRRIRMLVAGRVVRLVADAFTAAVRPLAAGQFQHLVYRGRRGVIDGSGADPAGQPEPVGMTNTRPRFSWPSTRPGSISVRPSYMCRSEPQILVRMIWMTASPAGRSRDPARWIRSHPAGRWRRAPSSGCASLSRLFLDGSGQLRPANPALSPGSRAG
jgi:hypothetical protein